MNDCIGAIDQGTTSTRFIVSYEAPDASSLTMVFNRPEKWLCCRMDWSLCPDVESVPSRLAGEWVVKGTRIPAAAIVANAEDGFTPEQIAGEIYPTVSVITVRRILGYVQTAAHAVHSA